MLIVVAMVIFEIGAVILVNNLRPFTLKRFVLSDDATKMLAFLVTAVLITSATFLFGFLVLGLIRYFPLNVAEGLWWLMTGLLLVVGTAGGLLLRNARQGNVAMICLILGLLSLFFLWLGRFIAG